MVEAMRYKIGIDVGGTFTDLFLWSPAGAVETFKVLSTPEDPSIGVLDGLAAIAESKGESREALAAQVTTIVHGTTVTTNAVLTRGGAKTGLITTTGVRDALEMRRGIREEQYNNRLRNVVPLVPRRLRRPVRGRLDHAGAELLPLAEDDVRAAASLLKQEGCAAVAVCLMNAFANPAHEKRVTAIVRAVLPGAYLSVSTEVLPTIRFYNRASTTVLNAYVGPVFGAYMQNLASRLKEVGFRGVLLIMQSNGGVALPEVTAQHAASTLLSGPAAGPRAGVAYALEHGRSDAVVVDMGGTSFDASLVQKGEAALNNEGEIDRLRIALPMLAITTIGAGGGSIGWVDEGGLLNMGPQSAGARPGPACYGRSGELATCTDADLQLGYLDPAYFAWPLALDVDEAAAGIYRVINTNMAHGVREVTVKRGLDPRAFPLVVAGGAGALHACMIARELEIPTLLVPPTASVLCAAGMLLSDLQHDFVRSFVTPLASADWRALLCLVDEMTAAGGSQLEVEGIPPERATHQAALDLRYVKQYHEVTVPVPRAAIERADLEAIAALFHARHNQLYGYDLAAEGTPLELINVRVKSVGLAEKPALPRLAAGGADPGAALKGKRRVFLPERSAFGEAPVYDGHRLRAGNVIPGPALIERTDTTIFVSESFSARVDGLGSCVLTACAGSGGNE
ncbi:MAG: hydantoinase/oxoprolinase family protein [Planctomycetes bacterium]|nr:hydantoinase/oxoprolinase family protein [Planctomycetota bacterium]